MADPQSTDLAIKDMDLIARRVAESRLFGLDHAQAFTLMLLAQAEGLPYISAVRRFHVIEGKPSMRADAMQAEFQRHGGVIRWLVTTDAEVKAEFSHPVHQPEPITIHLTFSDMAEKGVTQGFKGLKENWRKFPRQMLRARAISEGVRMVDPGIVVGIYTPEEVAEPLEVEGRPAPEHHAIHHDNGTGHGSGAYAPPEVVEAYQTFIETVVTEVNQKWLDSITTPGGEILAGDADVINTWQLSGHLLKWARSMDWVKTPLEVRAGQRDKFAAVAWEHHMEQFHAEARAYCRALWKEAKKKVKAAKKPLPGREEELKGLQDQDDVLDSLETSEAGARG